MTVIWHPRSTWSDQPSIGAAIDPTAVVGLALHHTVAVLSDYDRDGYLDGDLDDQIRYMQQLAAARPDLGADCPYSAVIFRGHNPYDATIIEGRGYGRRGAHTACNNTTRYGVAYAGDLNVDTWTPGLTAAFRMIGRRWVPHATAATLGHQQFPPCIVDGVNLNATACPGRHGLAALPELQPPFSEEEDDMFTDDDRRLLAFIHDQLRGVAHDGQPRPIRDPIGETARAVARIEAKVGAFDPASVDVEELAGALADQLGIQLARQLGETLLRGVDAGSN